MTNYISQISDAISLSANDIIGLYKRTGKDNSKFFPLLNYAAMRILPIYEEEQEKAALEWIGENISYDDAIGELYYIEEGQKYFKNDKIDKEKIITGIGDFI